MIDDLWITTIKEFFWWRSNDPDYLSKVNGASILMRLRMETVKEVFLLHDTPHLSQHVSIVVHSFTEENIKTHQYGEVPNIDVI